MEVSKQTRCAIITPSKIIDFGVLMGHVEQLPRTGLIQWGNDGTYILITYFAIFRNSFPPIWKKKIAYYISNS